MHGYLAAFCLKTVQDAFKTNEKYTVSGWSVGMWDS